MTPRERRARLFRKSRPFVRPLSQEDFGWLWAAYTQGSFRFEPGLSQEEFTAQLLVSLQGAAHYLVEDDNRKFASGRGPVALVGLSGTAEQFVPAVAKFSWATPRNVLRGFVAFFQWLKSEDVGECIVTAPAKDKLMRRMTDYGVLKAREMQTVYVARGKK